MKCKNSKLFLIDNGGHGFYDNTHMKYAIESTIEFISKNE